MTPQILLDALSHTYIKLDMIEVLIFDECHKARRKHPYACIMKVSYGYMLFTHVAGVSANPLLCLWMPSSAYISCYTLFSL